VTGLDAFQQLVRPSAEGSFRLGEQVCPGCRIAATHEGHLALLLDVVRTGTSTRRRFEVLHYDPPGPLEVFGGVGAARVEHLATLICRTTDDALRSTFLRIAVTLLDTTNEKLTEAELDARLDQLVSLFRALGRPSTQTIQGLWCELAVILWSPDARLALASWHSSPRALHDFGSGADRLEVKSCGTGMREHGVRLDQLQEALGGRTLVASVVLSEEDEGQTVADVCAAILERVDHDQELARRLEIIVTKSLGREWREAASRRWSLDDARVLLRFYDVRDVPTVPQPIPSEVRHVQFTVDLSTTVPLSVEQARSFGPFFQAMVPQGA
jgi:hypothetical protein